MDGVSSSAYGVALVLVNFAHRRRPHRRDRSHFARADDGCHPVRVPDPTRTALPRLHVVKDAGWISRPALGLTIIVTHLGLLAWELKYVAASLAYPGLKPSRSH